MAGSGLFVCPPPLSLCRCFSARRTNIADSAYKLWFSITPHILSCFIDNQKIMLKYKPVCPKLGFLTLWAELKYTERYKNILKKYYIYSFSAVLE
jgi:hypothetical protein